MQKVKNMTNRGIVLRYFVYGKENNKHILISLTDKEYIALLRLMLKLKEIHKTGEILSNYEASDTSFKYVVIGVRMSEIRIVRISMFDADIYVCIIDFSPCDLISALERMFEEGR